ncbi:MAG: outer membrane protein assembly factor BamC [Xylophilus sp.]|nr:outer membrane protein assembly factor BamC [Burkholderiaceae bacterium]MBP6651343.1 outer membrane protein assembly factor BamC [Xylophilus sp.]MBP7421158.1 outer membrane protein assembly factor BamC [Burkholderiaceae bacterium]MBP8151750.1 outer membrane protein assembly factor BamC [Xylophilus sp.]
MNHFAKLGLIGLSLAASACTTTLLDSDKLDYKSAVKGASLDVPPDLTQLSKDSRYVVTGGVTSASSYQGAAATSAVSTTAPAVVGDVRIERSGDQRWLVINRPADKLWDPVREFWQESGFNLTTDQAAIGIMETDWAENRAKIPQDFIRSTIGKVFDGIYSTGERDKFRTRVERNANGGTEIYITHRGMQEVYSNQSKDSTVWQARPTDPELEAEFLRRLMVKLGVAQEQSKALVAASAAGTAPQAPARVTTVNNVPVLQLNDGFDRAWRRVGLTLDRTGFTVEDRDRSQGLYFVRYIAPTGDKKEPGFFAKYLSFGSSNTAIAPLKYRVAVRSEGNATTVSVLNAAGAPETSADAQRILQVIADDLK